VTGQIASRGDERKRCGVRKCLHGRSLIEPVLEQQPAARDEMLARRR
jgi:hypothetical protein